MRKREIAACLLLAFSAWSGFAAKVNEVRNITVDNKERQYVLYVPDNVGENAPLVISLHGAAGHAADRSPFRTGVADAEGCIVAYPQGNDQYFPVFGGSIPGWNSTGVLNEDTDFFKAIIDAVDDEYHIDRNRVYCCGFSNGGMMTYANSSAASDIFAAYTSISGFPLNEFHLHTVGERPVPFMHIHGKQDDFVKYSLMPVIRDCMVARNGCEPVPVVTEEPGRFRKSVYGVGDGGFPYVYYEVDGMWHADFTDKTEEGNSAQTMWNFMSQYTLADLCDKTLKWRVNVDAEGFEPREHNWSVSDDGRTFSFGVARQPENADHNVYPSLQFNPGEYELRFEAASGAASSGASSGASSDALGGQIRVKLTSLTDGSVLLDTLGEVGAAVVKPFDVDKYDEYAITITKSSPDDKITSFAIHSTN